MTKSPTTAKPEPFTPEQQIVRLYGWVESWEEARNVVRAKLFGEMAARAIGITEHYLSDLFHDAEWILANVNGPTEFLWMTRFSGTNIADSAQVQERISGSDRRRLYHVALRVEGGQWSVTFTTLVSVGNNN